MAISANQIPSDAADEYLVKCAVGGDDNALACIITRYTPLIKAAVFKACNERCDSDDYTQEATLGLIKAIKNYREERGSFAAFAKLCVENELFSYIRSLNKKSVIPPDKIVELKDNIRGPQDPQDIYIIREEAAGIKQKIKSCLSELEFSVMRAYMMGESYEAIANELGITVKSVDNAVQRIRRKLK